MPPTPPSLNSNQFAQTAVRGQLDLQISKSGVIAGFVSPNQVGPIVAGDPVKLDPALTTQGMPMFLSAAPTDDALGVMIFNEKAATVDPAVNPNDPIEVALLAGPVIFEVAETTILAQQAVESNADGNMQPLGAGKQRGIALDPAVAGQLFRMIITNPVS